MIDDILACVMTKIFQILANLIERFGKKKVIRVVELIDRIFAYTFSN